MADRNLRWSVRSGVAQDGVTSNLFPLIAAQDTVVFRYELDVTRKPRVPKPGEQAPARPAAAVSPGRAWHMFSQSLRKHPAMPPMVRVANRVYTTSMLPESVLDLPKEFHDLGWDRCRLQPVDKVEMNQLSLLETRQLLNKMLPWALSASARGKNAGDGGGGEHGGGGGFLVVRDVDGKMVCTEDGIAVAGLRIFRGTTATVLQINKEDALGSASAGDAPPHSVLSTGSAAPALAGSQGSLSSAERVNVLLSPSSTRLGQLKPAAGAHVDAADLEVCCVRHIRSFEFRGNMAQVYMVRDASGTMPLTLWGFPTSPLATPEPSPAGGGLPAAAAPASAKAASAGTYLTERATYVFSSARCSVAHPTMVRGTFPNDLHCVAGKTTVTWKPPTAEQVGAIRRITDAEAAASGAAFGSAGGAGGGPPLELALRLDTRCSVAAEKSMWQEIKHHFGAGPYDEDKQRRIARAVQGTPVVLSTTLRHTSVRVVRFSYQGPDDAPLDPQLRQLSADIERGQPYAVLADYSVVPLQLLHCCYDPKMRAWQDVTVPACSFFPARRVGVLEKFRSALDEGLRHWGVSIAKAAWKTKSVALLKPPERRSSAAAASAVGSGGGGSPSSAAPAGAVTYRPRTVVVAAVCTARATPEDRERTVKTAQGLAKYHRTPHFIDCQNEADALAFVDRALAGRNAASNNNNNNNNGKDADCCALIVLPEKETRAARWVTAECLKRGVLPVLIRGVVGDKKQKLMCGNTFLQMQTRYTPDPTKGLIIGKDVAALKDRSVLVLGVDACHSYDITTGACVGLLLTPNGGNKLFPTFWRNEVRGQETEQVAENFGRIISRAAHYGGGRIDECIVFQDGNVYCELDSMKAKIPAGAGISFLCLHKRTHIRFLHQNPQKASAAGNVVSGSVVQSLTPVPFGFKPEAPSFYLQSHECSMSTARTVQYVVHALSQGLTTADIQRLSFVLSHQSSPLVTKLPLTTRCAHRLASQAERLIDACPDFKADLIPAPLCERAWFL